MNRNQGMELITFWGLVVPAIMILGSPVWMTLLMYMAGYR